MFQELIALSIFYNMPLVRIADVPLYLRDGDFYKALDNECVDEVLDIPEGTLKSDTRVDTSEELQHLLKSLQYWLVPDMPTTVFSYILGKPDLDCGGVICEFAMNFPVLVATWGVRESKERMIAAVICGFLELVAYLRDIGDNSDRNLCNLAAKYGNSAALKYFHSKGCAVDEVTFMTSAGNTNLDCLQYLYEVKCAWSTIACTKAAFCNNLEALKYLHERGCPWDFPTTLCAVQKGNLDCLIYTHLNGCPWDPFACKSAARWGHLDCLRYLHENDCACDAETCAAAAVNGHLKCLQYLHEQGCPWDANTPVNAATHGHLNCLKYAHRHGCDWHASTCRAAVENNQVECLKYALQHGCPCDTATRRKANKLLEKARKEKIKK